MTIEVWFDFCREAKDVITQLNEALDSFLYKDEIEVVYKSLSVDENNACKHALMHQARRVGLSTPLIMDLFDLSTNGSEINHSCLDFIKNKYELSEEFIENFCHRKYHHVLANHVEHAQLKKITKNPTLIFSSGDRMTSEITKRAIKLRLIAMYEKEKDMEYCDCEDCRRDS